MAKMWRKGILYFADGNTNWCHKYRKEHGSSQKNIKGEVSSNHSLGYISKENEDTVSKKFHMYDLLNDHSRSQHGNYLSAIYECIKKLEYIDYTLMHVFILYYNVTYIE